MTLNSDLRISEYRALLDLVRQMLSHVEYLVPFVWAQRQFREDNYQMSANSQLEAMFHDTFSTFLQWQASHVDFERNRGPEKWDYRVDGLQLSHKESKDLNLCLTFNWDSGTLIDGVWKPNFAIQSFAHPIVLVYTPATAASELRIRNPQTLFPNEETRIGQTRQLTHKSLGMSSQSKEQTRVLAGHLDPERTTFTAAAIWRKAEWLGLTLPTMLQRIGDDILNSELLLVTPTHATLRSIKDFEDVEVPFDFGFSDTVLPSGIYVLPEEWLIDLPVAANNRAHFVTEEKTRELIGRSLQEGLRVPLPLWPGQYLVQERTDLFQEMQRKYRALVHARGPLRR